MISVGEEVISFDSPHEIGLIQCIQVARGGGVEYLNVWRLGKKATDTDCFNQGELLVRDYLRLLLDIRS